MYMRHTLGWKLECENRRKEAISELKKLKVHEVARDIEYPEKTAIKKHMAIMGVIIMSIVSAVLVLGLSILVIAFGY